MINCASLPPGGAIDILCRSPRITSDIKNKRTIVDDTVLWSGDLATNFADVCKMLEVCHTAGLIFNSDKFQFGQDVVEFAGLEITEPSPHQQTSQR